MINNLYKRKDFLALLHKIMQKKELRKQKIYLTTEDNNNFSNQYYLATTIELVIKFSLLEIENAYIEQYINELDYLLDRGVEYIDYLKQANQLLLNYVSNKLEIEDVTLSKNKKEILEYTYNTYIKNGYYFAPFLNKDIDKVATSGLYLNQHHLHFDKMEEIEAIYLRKKLPFPFVESTKSMKKDYLEITDSLAVAYFQGVKMPQYLSSITSTYPNMQDEIYDQEAYLRKDKNVCLNNLEIFMTKNDFNTKEKRLIINFVDQSFETLKLNSKDITIAMIKRRTIGKDELKDYQTILEEMNNKDLVYSFSRIIDGRYISEKRFSKLLPKSIKIITLPSYYRIINLHRQQQRKDKKITKRTSGSLRHYSMAHGLVNVFALSGLILFITGLTLAIIITFMGV